MRPTLSDKLFLKFASLLFNETGIHYKENKKLLLANRIFKRLKELNIETFDEYYQYLIKNYRREVKYFIDCALTYETSFFRNPEHFEALVKIIQSWVKEKKEEIIIWSAGCSTGEEPYSIAMTLQMNFPDKNNFKIYATDISYNGIRTAIKGIYPARKIEKVPPLYRKFFKPIGNKQFVLEQKIIKSVKFHILNLIKDPYPRNVDIIFCRNVLIYFESALQRKIIKNFHNSLKSKGYLFPGTAESLSFLTDEFRQERIGKAIVYRRID